MRNVRKRAFCGVSVNWVGNNCKIMRFGGRIRIFEFGHGTFDLPIRQMEILTFNSGLIAQGRDPSWSY